MALPCHPTRLEQKEKRTGGEPVLLNPTLCSIGWPAE